MDIKPPQKRPLGKPEPLHLPAPVGVSDDIDVPQQTMGDFRRRRRRVIATGLIGLAIGVVLICIGAIFWYTWALNAPSKDSAQTRLVVNSGDTASTIADRLHEAGLIRSELAFHIYTQLTGNRSKLQAGGYVLSRNQSLASIVDHITTGQTDTFNLTISPGLTLVGLREQLRGYGYSDIEINDALDTNYPHPLLVSKPADATLEGYIFPETYNVGVDQPLSTLFKRSFDELYQLITEKKYLEEYTKRGLTIHQALTLASIVQKEVSGPVDQKQVAQVFLKRLNEGTVLGSDVTFIYAAKLRGVEPSVSIDSPYNTRRYAGLPPGPIANMNPSALEAVAFPAAGDYLFFVAGDDGKTYFSHTEAEHNENVAKHCKTLCN